MTPVESLIERIREAAELMNLESVDHPPQLSQPQLLSCTLQKVTGQTEPPVDEDVIAPSELHGLFVGRYAFLVSSLGDADGEGPEAESVRNVILERWSDCQRRCAIARTWLSTERSDDLTLLLTGPLGSKNNPHWGAMAAGIERNDLVCRKLVWLPPASESHWDEDLNAFMSRTSLARPWAGAATTEQKPLDELSDVKSLLKGWEAILEEMPVERDEVDHDELIGKLIEATPHG